MTMMASGENEVDRRMKREKQAKGEESQGTIKITHPALAGLKEGDYATMRVCVVKPGETATVEIMDVQPEENKADYAMKEMMGNMSQGQSGMEPGKGNGEEY